MKSGKANQQDIDAWELRQLDEQILATLSNTYGKEMLTMLCSALDACAESPNEDDFSSTLWLEDFQTNPEYTHQKETILAVRTYAVCRDLIKKGGSANALWLDVVLRRQQWALFRRLRWQLYSDFPEYYLQQARDDVLERIPRLDRDSHRFEFQKMIAIFAERYRGRFLAPQEVLEVVQAISNGPHDADGKLDQDQAYVARFRAKQIEPFRSLLRDKELFRLRTPDGTKVTFEAQEYKPIQFSGGRSRVIEERGPLTAKELLELEDRQLWDLLNNWEPDGSAAHREWWIEQGVAGLANAFTEAIELDVPRFNSGTKWWQNVKRPAILWRILDRALLDENVTKPAEDKWDIWFGVCDYVVSQRPIEQPGDTGLADDSSSAHPTWKYARWSVARLIERMLRHKHGAPERYGERMANLLRQLATEDDPRVEETEKWSSDSFDWLSRGINSAAGTAVEALLQFPFWSKKTRPDSTGTDWISEILLQQLTKQNQSPAIFAVVGSRLPVLAYFFPEWCKQQASLIFPFDLRPSHAEAALLSHLTYNNPNDLVIKSFPDLLDQALRIIDFDADSKSSASRAEMPLRLGYHLSYYYWNALPDETVAARRLGIFFERATSGTRGRLIAQVAQVFEGAPPDASADIIKRAQALWDKRFGVISGEFIENPKSYETFAPELEAFIYWIEDNCFDAGWRLSRFASTLKLLRKAPMTLDIGKTFESLSSDTNNLNAVMECLQLLTQKLSDTFQWSISIREEGFKETLKRGLHAEDSGTKKLAEAARDNLLKQGLFAYLDT